MITAQVYIPNEIWFDAYFRNKGQKPLTQEEIKELKRECYTDGWYRECEEPKQELPQFSDLH